MGPFLLVSMVLGVTTLCSTFFLITLIWLTNLLLLVFCGFGTQL